MDHLEALIAIAHRRLRLRRFLVAIERNPQLLDEEIFMAIEIKRPMELAGLKSRLVRSQETEKAIAFTGKRYDAVLDKIDELHGAHRRHVGSLEGYSNDLESAIERMVGSNGDPNEGGQDGHKSDGELDKIGQVITSKTGET